MHEDLRCEARNPATLPVRLATGHPGQTRDISAHGLYIEVDTSWEAGSDISLDIELDSPTGPLRLKAQGVVVRVEPNGKRTGVAVRLVSSRLIEAT